MKPSQVMPPQGMLVTMLPRAFGILTICGAFLSAVPSAALPSGALVSLATGQYADAPFLAKSLGRAYVPVDGAWAFRPGDDPVYASP
jgi:hypothetical protein